MKGEKKSKPNVRVCDVWRQTVEKCVCTTRKLLLPSYFFHPMVRVGSLYYNMRYIFAAVLLLRQLTIFYNNIRRYTTTGHYTYYNRGTEQFSHCSVFTTFTTVLTTMVV